MRVLIVHDRSEVLDELAALVLEHVGGRCVVDRACDMVSGRDKLRDRHYDLAIIDLTLPAVVDLPDKGLQHADWLLKEAFAGLTLKTPANVIAISEDAEAVRGIRNDIGEHVLAVISQEPDGRWRSQIREKLNYVRNTSRSRLLAANSAYDLDIAIVTALDKECQPYHRLLELEPSDEFDGAFDFTLRSADDATLRGIVVSVGRSGQAPMAATTQAVLTQFRPQLFLMTGFCGGVEGKVAFGDVAVFRSSAAWDYGKWVEVGTGDARLPRFLPRAEAVSIDAGKLERVWRTMDGRATLNDRSKIQRIAEMSGDRVQASIVRSVAAGSGSSVVTSENMLGRIVDNNDGIHAIDMESHGFYHACRHTPVVRPDYGCIKGVADFCNGLKDDRLHDVCSELSALVALEIIRERYNFDL
jgi:nucleoside phosphorylase